jgi:hypothetical protein
VKGCGGIFVFPLWGDKAPNLYGFWFEKEIFLPKEILLSNLKRLKEFHFKRGKIRKVKIKKAV